MAEHLQISLGVSRLQVRFTTVSDGDFAPLGSVPDMILEDRRARIHPAPWTWLHQVHGADVVLVGAPGDRAGSRADAAVTTEPDTPLAIHTADCVPVVLASDDVLGTAHVGWRGLVSGVLASTLQAMRTHGAARISAVLGPHVCAAHYEFGSTDLDRVAGIVGPEVRATTPAGTPALDMTEAVTRMLDGEGVEVRHVSNRCTTGDPDLFSHRGRGDRGRQATVAWLERT